MMLFWLCSEPLFHLVYIERQLERCASFYHCSQEVLQAILPNEMIVVPGSVAVKL